MTIKKFRKLPVEIEAIQFTGNNYDDINDIDELGNGDRVMKFYNDNHIAIVTLEGEMRVNIGDWIIKGVAGEIYPCKPDIFEQTYEEVK